LNLFLAPSEFSELSWSQIAINHTLITAKSEGNVKELFWRSDVEEAILLST
jgi:hypothetical protein